MVENSWSFRAEASEGCAACVLTVLAYLHDGELCVSFLVGVRCL